MVQNHLVLNIVPEVAVGKTRVRLKAAVGGCPLTWTGCNARKKDYGGVFMTVRSSVVFSSGSAKDELSLTRALVTGFEPHRYLSFAVVP